MIKLQEKNFFEAYHSAMRESVKNCANESHPKIRACRLTNAGGYFLVMNIKDSVFALSSTREDQRRFGRLETVSALLQKNSITVFTVADLGWAVNK
jgi:hypothetical protein